MVLEILLKFLANDVDVLHRLQAAVRRRDHSKKNLDNALDRFRVRNDYRLAVHSTASPIEGNGGPWLNDPARLAMIMRKMDISVDELIDRCPYPFFNWMANERILILLGTRSSHLQVDSKQVASFDAISCHDDEARTYLSDRLQDMMRCRIEVERFPADLSFQEADAHIGQLIDSNSKHRPPNLGAIIVIGAPPTNPMAEPFAQRILLGEDSPYQFRWSSEYDMSRFNGHPVVLSHRKNCQYEQEGLGVPNGDLNVLQRRRLNVDSKRYKNVTCEGYDCGLILMNSSYNETHPRLILLAGHGAAATVAATYALLDDALRSCLVRHETMHNVEHVLIKVVSPNCEVKPTGRSCGWEINHDPILYGDDDES